RRRTYTRSRTGCRTCRARRIRCDEQPDACKNCTSTGRKCDYDLHRLPWGRQTTLPGAITVQRHEWILTSDEQRCFSYFQHRTVSSVAELFDSPLWESHILRLSFTEPAVCHAVNMLSAIQQAAETNRMRLTGAQSDDDHLKFALEQSVRASALLRRRQGSNDPQLIHTVLICCLLFVIGEHMRGNFDITIVHAKHGVRIMREAQSRGQRIDPALVDYFHHLDMESDLYCQTAQQGDTKREEPDWVTNDHPIVIQSVADARVAFMRISNQSIGFIGHAWQTPKAKIHAEYDAFWLARQRILSRYQQFTRALNSFYETQAHTLTSKEHRAVTLLRELEIVQTLSLRLTLHDTSDASDQARILSDFTTLLSSSLAVIGTIARSTTTVIIEPLVIGGLHIVATQCPDFTLRVQALDAMRSWPHSEGLVNSEVWAALATEALRADLLQRIAQDGENRTGVAYPMETDRFLVEVLRSSHTAKDWAPVRAKDL
ncbi:Zn(II)2Cys6 transcription factor domain-containing protein, partial [Aspergillus brunneoviolaceus CBS 621.78]